MKRNAFVVSLLGFSMVFGLGAVARAAGADDEVELADGTVLEGRITQQVPGSFVVIQTPDGRVQSVPWSEVKRVVAAAPTPAPAPAAVPAPASDLAAPLDVPSAPTRPRHPHVHLELGARAGYAFASGDYASGVPLGNASTDLLVPGVKGSLPIALDLGLRLGPYVFLGGFAQYAFVSTTCLPAAPGATLDCSGHDVRAGLDVQVHLLPRGEVDPWIGFGFGHEWLTSNIGGADASGGQAQVTTTFDGWNLADVMLGVDLRAARGLGVGPYLELTSGSFASASQSSTGQGSASGDIGSTSPHQWFTLGVRGTFEVPGDAGEEER